MNTLKGMPRSVTMIAALIILILSNIAPLMPVLMAQLKADPGTVQAIGTLGAIIMAVCRVITTTSLADKVAGTEAAPVSEVPKT